MIRATWLCLILTLFATGTALCETASPLFPFVLPWDDASRSITNVSGWLERPAGKSGYVTAKNGHLYAGDRRIRFFGVNCCFGAAFPKHEDAEKVAARMAKFGINCVRFHHMDSQAAPNGIMAKDLRGLDAGQLDRLDYFIAQLKKNGIYADINLHVSRTYPGWLGWEGMPHYWKGVDNFFPPMIAMQRDYARELLTHQNPYTGTRYADEPAVAFVEINNENGLIHEWWNGSLEEMTEPYAGELKKQWNAWLKDHYRTADALKSAWSMHEEAAGPEMLTNGDFSQGMTGWGLENIGQSQAISKLGPIAGQKGNALNVKVTNPGESDWHVQVWHKGLSFEKGKIYTLSLRAKADSPRKIAINAMDAQEPWGHIWYAQAKLSDEWNEYRFTFCPSRTEKSARITLSDLSQSDAEFQFAGLSLKRGGSLKFSEGESLGSINPPKRPDFLGYPMQMQRDWVRFLYDTETQYWTGMARFLREELGTKAPIIGTQTNFSPAPIQAKLDVVDAHAYWKHPNFPHKPWDAEDWYVGNASAVGVADGGPLAYIATTRVAGKPFVVTEYNHPAPNTYSSETLPLMAAFGALQDWDGIFAFSYCHRKDNWDTERIPNFFDIDQHPTKMATLPASAAIFLRGDLGTPAPYQVGVVSLEKALEAIRQHGPYVNSGESGVNSKQATQTPVALCLEKKAPIAKASVNQGFAWISGQKPAMTVSTERTKMAIGSVEAGPFALGEVSIAPGRNRQNWAAISLTAMDGKDFPSPGRILLTATGDAENTGMVWETPEKSSVGKDWGSAPSLVEGIPAAITLPVPAKRVRAWALDELGHRKDSVSLSEKGGKAVLEISEKYRTLWYEIEIR